MSNSRLTYIDSVKGFGILLVIINHILPKDHAIVVWLSTFHMPLFFIISGFLFSVSLKWKNRSILDNAKHFFKNILLPYFSFCAALSLFIMIYYAISGNSSYNSIILDIIKQTVFLEGYGPMWFLFTLFFSEIIFVSLKKLNIHSLFILIGAIVLTYIISKLNLLALIPEYSLPVRYLLTLLLVFGRACLALSFLSIGFILSDLIKQNYSSKLIRNSLFISIVLITLNIFTFNINEIIIVSNLQLNNFILFYFISILVSFAYIFLFKHLSKNLFDPIFRFFGKNSLTILCTHETYYFIAFSLWASHFISSSINIQYALAFIFTCIIEYLFIQVLGAISKYKKRVTNICS